MKNLKILLSVLLLLLVASLSIFLINDADTMQYLASGKYILEHGIYQNCVFNYTTNQCQIVYPEWLFHLITYLVYSIGKYNALVIFQALLAVAIFSTILIHNFKFNYRFYSSFIFIFFAAMIAMERFMLRADLLGILLAILLYFLLKVLNDKRQLLNKNTVYFFLAVLFLQIVWANTHNSFPLAFLIILFFLLHEILMNLWDKYYLLKKADDIVSPRVKALSMLLFLSLGVSLLNPYGIKSFLQPFKSYFHGSDTLFQVEFASPFDSSSFEHLSVKLFKIIAIISPILLTLTFKKIKIRDILILGTLLFLAVQSVRNIALFSVFAAMILPEYLDDILEKLNPRINSLLGKDKINLLKKQGLRVVYLVFAFIILALIVDICNNNFYLQDNRSRRFGIGISETKFPIRAVQFISDNKVEGNMFNNYDVGGYLNWALFPKIKSFIDGHSYTPKSYKEYSEISAGQIPYSETVKKYKINFFLLSYTGRDTSLLVKKLYNDIDWIPIYFDETSIIFVKNNDKNKNLIEKYEVNFDNNKNYNPDKLVAITDRSNRSLGYAARGVFFINLNLWDKAVYELEKSVSVDPKNYLANNYLGYAYESMGKDDQALVAYKNSIKYQKDWADSHFNIASLYLKRGLANEAKHEFQKTLKINSKRQFANYALGIIYQSEGEQTKAIEYYMKELEINPSFGPALEKLQMIRQLNP